MTIRIRIALILTSLLLSACSGFTLPFAETPTPTATERPPPATLTLPPAPTPTKTPTPLPTLAPTPKAARDDQSAALLPAFAEDVELFPKATRYWIEVEVDFHPLESMAVMKGITRIRFTNPLHEALQDLVVMLWPNDVQFQATMTAGPALIDGRLVQPEAELGGLALRMRLPHALSAGNQLDVSIPFWIEVGQLHPYLPQRFGIAEGVLIAPTFYPLIPRLVNGEWQVDLPPEAGDRTNSEVAFYHVEITSPTDLSLVASGTVIATEQVEEGKQRSVYVTGPMRDFAFAIGDLETKSRKVGDVLLNAWVLPEHTDDLEKMLNAAALQFGLMSELIGPYPYHELDMVDAPGAFGGVEYPGLVYIGTVGTPQVIRPLIHEVAHQWFYGLIGDDQLNEPWLDEAATTYTEVLYYEHIIGVGQATGYLTNLRAMLREHPDPTQPIGLRVGEYDTPSDYGLFVYRKGALFFDALRREMGDQVFFEFLQLYFQRFRYRFTNAQDFQDVAEETCDCDLDGLFDLWVYQGGELPIP